MSVIRPRPESAGLLRGDIAYELPSLEGVDEIVDIQAALDAVQPLRYAKLAETIDVLFEDMQERQAERLPTGLLTSPEQPSSPWQQVRNDTVATVVDSIDRISQSQPYTETTAINNYIGTLDPEKSIDVQTQLISGVDTAASSMLTLLKNVPAIVEYHNGTQSKSQGVCLEIARNSHGLPLRLAMTCINKMMASQAALIDNRHPIKPWADIDVTLDPTHFNVRLQRTEDVHSAIRFPNLFELPVPEDYKDTDDKPVTSATKVGEVACFENVVIGCPITLLSGRMRQLWNWYIDIVASENLWGIK